MLCNRCGQHRSRYSVCRPHGGSIKLCPSCFQRGINKKRIVWLGRKAVAV
jgi:hypothetical protein